MLHLPTQIIDKGLWNPALSDQVVVDQISWNDGTSLQGIKSRNAAQVGWNRIDQNIAFDSFQLESQTIHI